MGGEILALFSGQIDAVFAGSLPGESSDSGTGDGDVLPPFHQATEERLSQGAAAGVSGADKEDVFQRTPRVPRWGALSKGR